MTYKHSSEPGVPQERQSWMASVDQIEQIEQTKNHRRAVSIVDLLEVLRHDAIRRGPAPALQATQRK